MELDYERQLNKHEMEPTAARHEADQQRIEKLRLVADKHKRYCRAWETKHFGQPYNTNRQPIFPPLNISTSSIVNSDVTA